MALLMKPPVPKFPETQLPPWTYTAAGAGPWSVAGSVIRACSWLQYVTVTC
jgi:hypothetical protein